MNDNVEQFVSFVVEALSENWNKTNENVYEILKKTNILDSYIIKCYDVLHTLSKEYLVEDLTNFVKEKGIEL